MKKIPINTLINYLGNHNKRLQIIKVLKEDKPIQGGYYQTSRACIRKSLLSKGDTSHIFEGLERLTSKIAKNSHQELNRIYSIKALNQYLSIKIPNLLKNHQIDLIRHKIKSTQIKDLDIQISPEIIFTMNLGDKKYLGAIKMHFSKEDIFDQNQLQTSSSLIYKYLAEISYDLNAEVLPELCFSIDVFGKSYSTCPFNNSELIQEIEKVADNINIYWKAA
tara:strand:+ start:1386 stop:2048 length:663 start_codon:yes stop_codon:yes gene_type:complete